MSAPMNVEALAACFAGVLRGWLTDVEWAEMRSRNAAQDPDAGWCASHDHCDANMAMEAAWLLVMERHADPSTEADSNLWNEAWDVAKREYLSGATTHECDYCRVPSKDEPAEEDEDPNVGDCDRCGHRHQTAYGWLECPNCDCRPREVAS